MKNLFLAAMLAIATLAPTAVPVQAASLTVTTEDGMGQYGYNWRHHGWRHHPKRHHGHDYWRHGRHHRDHRCFVREHRRWHHHHWVVKRVWSCGLHRGWYR